MWTRCAAGLPACDSYDIARMSSAPVAPLGAMADCGRLANHGPTAVGWDTLAPQCPFADMRPIPTGGLVPRFVREPPAQPNSRRLEAIYLATGERLLY